MLEEALSFESGSAVVAVCWQDVLRRPPCSMPAQPPGAAMPLLLGFSTLVLIVSMPHRCAAYSAAKPSSWARSSRSAWSG